MFCAARLCFIRCCSLNQIQTTASYFRKLRLWLGPCMTKFFLLQQKAVAEHLAVALVTVLEMCLWTGRTCYESAEQVPTHLLASLDSFPGWRELYENTIFTNSCFLIKVNEAPGPLNHSFLIKGQPLKQEQDCLKLDYKCSPSNPIEKHCPVLSGFICQ